MHKSFRNQQAQVIPPSTAANDKAVAHQNGTSTCVQHHFGDYIQPARPTTLSMHFVIKLFPEITIKSPPVRSRMSRQLTDNIRLILKRHFGSAKVIQDWDKLDVEIPGESDAVAKAATHLLSAIPGIANLARVRVFPLESLQDIYERAQHLWGAALEGKRFCVRVKRNGKHPFTSTDVERFVGGGLRQHNATAGVDLKTPDITVQIEVRDDRVYLVEQKTPGLGGFPLGSQEAVLSLVSGGFDSTVASYQCIRRGLRTHFCFFNLGGKAHELGVKEIAFYLWNRFGATHRVKFVTVNFVPVVNDILEKIDPSCMGVVLKRLMLRAASKIAERGDITALVTGEAVAQVSSQTLTNLQIIDRVTDTLVLRPLALMDKGEIIDVARAIGAEHFSASIPEYCGVISVKPSAHLKLAKVLAQEQHLDETIFAEALEHAQVQNIDAVMADVTAGSREVELVSVPVSGDIIIDIRHPDEIDNKPRQFGGHCAIQIPFYQLSNKFPALDATKRYLLFCDKGVMSQLHAVNLRDSGEDHVAVYRPI
jgi:tRNA uracil 4-sulfurtransferase